MQGILARFPKCGILLICWVLELVDYLELEERWQVRVGDFLVALNQSWLVYSCQEELLELFEELYEMWHLLVLEDW